MSTSPTLALPPLPYANDALAPHISVDTVGVHYGKHHAAYVANVNRLVAGDFTGGRSAGADRRHRFGWTVQ